MTATRRDFLSVSAGGGALVLLFHVTASEGAESPEPSRFFEPNAYLRIGEDDTVTISVTRQEMGQGVRTLLPMILVEELEADWSLVRLEQAVPGPRFKDIRLHTSGSGSTSGAYRSLRLAGAAARELLIGAAAARWGVPEESCRAQKSAVLHPPSGRSLRFGALTADAARRSLAGEPKLKDQSRFTVLGRPLKRLDGPDIVTGRAVYGLDVRVPGLLFASIERAPRFGLRVAKVDDVAARAIPGVLHVVPVSSGIHPGVAVVARDSWTALRGREALRITWDESGAVPFDSALYLEGLAGRVGEGAFPVREEGDVSAPAPAGGKKLRSAYLYPFQAHAALEPMNCTAHVQADRAEFWAPTQTPFRSMEQAVRVTGLPEERITLHSTLMGGGFGRRLFADYLAEAAEVSKQISAPVQVFWTREDDLRFGFFQPATAEVLEGTLDERGRLRSLTHNTSASDLTIYDRHEGRRLWPRQTTGDRAKTSYADSEAPWGAFDTPYAIPNLRVRCADITSPVPTGPWRAVQYPSTVFGRECFIDELAHAAARDPLELRLELLPSETRQIGSYAVDRSRLAFALREAARLSGWSTPLPKDERLRGRGIAASVYHGGSYIAMVAEVSLRADLSDLRVHRIVAAVDCGLVLNPLGLRGQAESAIAWGLSATLLGKTDFRSGRAVQGSLNDFQCLRLDHMPETVIHLIPSTARPGGFGEHPVPQVAPAVANAVFAATGKRIRRLPIDLQTLRET